MTYHANARTNIQQRQRIRQSRDPYRVQAEQLGVSVATVAKWTDRDNPRDRTSRPHRIQKALPPEAAPLLTWLRRDWLADLDTVWLAMRQTVFPQLSRSAVYRELVRLELHQLRTLRPQAPRRQGKFRACPPGFLHVDVFYLPRLDGRRRYLFVAIDRATRLLTMQVYETRETASALAFVAHCQRFYPFRLYRLLTDNGKEFTLRGYRGRGGATTAKVHPFTQACRHAKIRHSLKSLSPVDEWAGGTDRQHDQDRDGLPVPFRHGCATPLGALWLRTLLQRPSPVQGHGREDPAPTHAGVVRQATQAVPPGPYRAVHNVVKLDSYCVIGEVAGQRVWPVTQAAGKTLF